MIIFLYLVQPFLLVVYSQKAILKTKSAKKILNKFF
jgi:hypothetical protein